MIIKITIENILISKQIISIRLNAQNDNAIEEELKKIKKKSIRFSIDNIEKHENILYFTGKLHSINIRKGLNFVIHTTRDTNIIYKLIKYIDAPLKLKFTSEKEEHIIKLLNEIHNKTGKEITDIIYENTCFKTKDGKTIEGKKNIFELTEKRKDVLLGKLQNQLKNI